MYNPFQNFTFDQKTCFLSGEKLVCPEDEQINVFPLWLMQRYQLEDKPFKLLDESICTYKQLKLPCSTAVSVKLDELETEINTAFSAGFEAVRALEPLRLFQWIAKMVYGMVFNEIRSGIKQQAISGEAMNFSQVLAHKFTNLHLMLQSLLLPVEFDGGQPFYIGVYKVANPDEAYNYRDEINTLVFSFRANDFGIIACLQDNKANSVFHREVLAKVANHELHPVQFEELCARFFYSAYLFNRLPEYTVVQTDEAVYIEPMPLTAISSKPVFDPWQVKTYGQVLENFWKPWGFLLFEIIKDPENPMTFLLDDQGEFLPSQKIALAKY
ncbi:hypothetical protein SAMN05216436_101335 [bacterium A37T11]|nr:hypothetical protein SAMN05216436_101335 [bacterium A37T11]